MKIHCYYIVKDSLDIDEFTGIKVDTICSVADHEYSLYAYTPENKSAELFSSTRNMATFYEKIVDMTRDDYESFCDEYSDYLLEYHLFKTKTIENGIYRSKDIYFLTTKIESDLVLYYGDDYFINIISDIWLIDIIPNDIKFNDKILSLLRKYFYYDEVSNLFKEINISYTDIGIDQFALFIRLFYNTLTKNKKGSKNKK